MCVEKKRTSKRDIEGPCFPCFFCGDGDDFTLVREATVSRSFELLV